MSGIYYALSLIAIFVIVRWFIANDKSSPDEPVQGLLAVKGSKKTEAPAEEAPQAPSWRRREHTKAKDSFR